MQNSFYREIITDHNLHPIHKHEIDGSTIELEGINPRCGDDIILKLRLEEGKIVDGGYVGDGCAISQASADMMLELVIGKTEEEALRLADIFLRMIKGDASLSEIGELEEASALSDISHMPARVKCAVLGWHTLKAVLQKSL